MKHAVRMMTLLAVLLCATVSFAGSLTVYNGLPDSAITNLYISESNVGNWEEDVLGNDVLYPGEGVQITFYGGGCYWDMLAMDEYGNQVDWRGLNLCGVGNITLLPGGEAQLY